MASKKNIEDIYPLTPLQKGMLFHSLHSPESNIYFERMSCRLEGAFNAEAFSSAWQRLADRHTILRTSFVWRKQREPVQVVKKEGKIPLKELDWRNIPPQEQEEKLERFYEEEEKQGFALNRAPLMRVTTIRLSDNIRHFVLCHHHLLLDGWSLPLLIQEFFTLYRAACEQQQVNLPPAPPFSRYVSWLQRQNHKKAETFWRHYLENSEASGKVSLPAPPVSSEGYAEEHFTFSTEETNALIALTRRLNITLNTLFQGAWGMLSARYERDEEALFGITVTVRPPEINGIDRMLGLLINTVPLRLHLPADARIDEWLREIQLQYLEMQEFEYSELSDIHTWSGRPKGEDFFESLLVFENYPMGEAIPSLTGGLSVHNVQAKEQNNFPLSLIVVPGKELFTKLSFNRSRFSASAMRRILRQLHCILLQMTADETKQLRDISLNPVGGGEEISLSGQQRNTPFLTSPNKPEKEKTVLSLFQKQVTRFPGKTALVSGDEKITYQQLDERSNRLAHHLKKQGVREEKLVGLLLNRSVDLIIGILGILKAGGAYVPLDPENPHDRLSYIAEDSRISLLLTETDLLQHSALQRKGLTPVCMDRLKKHLSQEPAHPPETEPSPHQAMYVIYTSGSTGKPKGCVITHHNVFRLFRSTEQWFHFREGDVWTLFHSQAFDFSVWEIWGALLHGGSLIIVPHTVSRDPEAFYHLLQKEQVTILNQTPSAFRLLRDVVERKGKAVNALRFVIFGGEALDFTSLRPWFERHGDRKPRLINMFGITETTVHVTYRPVTMEDVIQAEKQKCTSLIGIPIPDLTLHIRDHYGHPAPVGMAGELYVAGEGLAREYLNRPELTQERFIIHVSGEGRKTRLYKTGDLVREREDGDIEYLGRIDKQVKIRGFRIEIGEIETKLMKHPDVEQVVVLAQEDKSGLKKLVGYVRGGSSRNPTQEELHLFLSEWLPHYMLPAPIWFIEEFPLTANGKIDVQSLPSCESSLPEHSYIAPATEEEKTLAKIWSDVLSVEKVGVEDNFFVSGGDSIKSISVCSCAEKAGISFSIRQLFRYPTISSLLKNLKEEDETPRQTGEIPPFSLIAEEDKRRLPADIEDAFPLARLQSGMLFHSGYEEGSTLYHDIFSYHLSIPFNRKAFKEALAWLTRRHGTLRTSFDLESYTVPLQLVHTAPRYLLETDDISSQTEEEQEESVRLFIEEERKRGFITTEPPLIRYHIHIRSRSSLQFSISMHHAIIDGWSVATMMAELLENYYQRLGLIAEKPALLSPLPYRYFIALEQEACSDGKMQEFWRKKLERSFFQPLPRRQKRYTATKSPAFTTHHITCSSEVSEQLKQLAKSEGIPVKTVLLTAHMRVMGLLSASAEVVTGLVTNGRPEREGAELSVGLFLNTLPFQLTLTRESWRGLVKTVFREEQELLAHRRFPIAEIQKITGGKPLFETDFNFVQFHVLDSTKALPGFQSISNQAVEETNFVLAVNFSIDRNKGRITCGLTFDLREIAEEQAVLITGYYERTLKSIAEAPDELWTDTSCLTEAERNNVLTGRNTTRKKPAAGYRFVHEQVLSQAERTPHAVALSGDGTEIRYGELNETANQLARYLIGCGVKPDDVVGVYMNPSPRMAWVLLGILKAGGAYLPLDPSYPEERRTFMQKDAGIHLMITEKKLRSGITGKSGMRILCIDDKTETEEIMRAGREEPDPLLTPDNLAYIIYTSGSTGKPKGVEISHSALSNHMEWFREEFCITEKDCILQKTPVGFDASVWEFWVPLISGAKIVFIRPGGHRDAHYLAEKTTHDKITVLQVVPTLLEALLEEPEIKKAEGLRILFSGGERLSRNLHRRFFNTLHNVQLVNLYGPAEATIDAAFHICSADEEEEAIPLGEPIARTRLYVLDPFMQPVPAGSRGELWIGGAALARGYRNQPRLTAEAFLPDPFSENPEERIYRTGDMAYVNNEGTLFFAGRRDEQVKVGGVRIEPGEIKAALEAHPAVSLSEVILHTPEKGQKSLVAYVIPATKEKISEEELQNHLKRKLPETMVPRFILFLQEFPLSPNGKIDRKALPLPEATVHVRKNTYTKPETEAEKHLAEVWSKVLGVTHAGKKDNFFEAGGDSILSLQVVSGYLRSGWRVTSKIIFEQQTLEKIAAAAVQTVKGSVTANLLKGEVPLTPVQKRFFSENGDHPHHWNQSTLLETKQGFDPQMLRKLLDEIARKRGAIRLYFFKEEGEWKQAYRNEVPEIPLEVFDWSEKEEDEQSSLLHETAEKLQRSLHITKGPLIRTAWFNFGSRRRGRLLIVIHHLIVDGVSWRLLQEDLLSLNQAGQEDSREIILPEESASFKEWACRLHAYADSAPLQEEASFWLNPEKASVKPLPVDFPMQKEENLEATAEVITHSFDEEETKNLLQVLPQKLKTRTDVLLLTALTETITDWSAGEALPVDLEGHGREEIGTEVNPSRVMGWFTSIFPVLLKRRKGCDRLTLLKSVKETIQTIPDNGIGYGLLRYLSRQNETADRLAQLPESEISFNYLGQFSDMQESSFFSPAKEDPGKERSPHCRRAYLIDIIAIVSEGRLKVQWIYSNKAHKKTTIEKLSSYFSEHLKSLSAYCSVPASQIRTPSDFPLSRLDQQSLEQLIQGKEVENIYPLSPLQEGMLYHTLDDSHKGLYIQQMVTDFEGTIERQAFENAWKQVIQRHESLRTSFHTESSEMPLQVVHQEVSVPFRWHDWRDLPPEKQDEMWQNKLKTDREKGFILHNAPLMRFEVIRLTNRKWRTLWTHHHIIADGWSVPIILKEVFDFYHASLRNKEFLPAPAVSYSDYISLLLRQDTSAAESFWKKTLSGFREATAMLLEAPPREGTSHTKEYDEAELTLPKQLTAQLTAFAKEHHITLNTLMQGMWALLLYRCGRQRDILFGQAVSGRSADLQGIESLVGLCINTLPLRTEISPFEHLADFLKRIQKKGAESVRYEHTSLAQIQSWSDIPKGSPLFESIFIFENYPLEKPLQETAPSELKVLNIETSERNNYPLTLYVTPGERIHLKIAFRPQRFTRSAIIRLLHHASTLLGRMISEKNPTVGSIGLLDKKAETELAEYLTVKRKSFPTLPELFCRQVGKTPHKTAVVCKEDSVTYGELHAASDIIARYLIQRGIHAGHLVGIYIDRSLTMLSTLLGILKSGAAYVPLDPSFPSERINIMTEESNLSAIMTRKHLISRLSVKNTPLICVEDIEEEEQDTSTDLTAYLPKEDDTAYVIFTSGSTGRPKGVQVLHKGLSNILESFSEKPGLSETDTFLAITTISFDIAALELYLPLITGARLVIADKETASDGILLSRTIQESRCTTLQGTPATWRMLLNADFRPPEGMKLWCGGEALTADLAEALSEKGSELWNLYGPTETTIWSLIQRVCKKEDALSIGVPVHNTVICIADSDLNPLPEGVAGELLIGGYGLAAGYYNQPDMTGEKFIRLPVSRERLYRTGDLARLGTDGKVTFLGRIDQQVKIRGFRIEPGEIEAVLTRHHKVSEAVVIPREDCTGAKQLVAYVVLRKDAEEDFMAELREKAEEVLPSYMIPDYFIPLEHIPLTPNGKTDRKKLPAPHERLIQREYIPPRNRCEETLAAIWSEVLGVERTGVEDRFFDLGGHSLLATRIIARLNKAFQVHMPVRTLFETETIAALARKVEESRNVLSASGRTPLRADPEEEKPLLSFAQQRLWFIEQFEEESSAYNISGAFRLTGDLNENALQKALYAVTERHETLRTRFAPVNGRPVLIREEHLTPPMDVITIDSLPEESKEERIKELINETAQKPFTLSEAPLFRVQLLKLSPEDKAEETEKEYILSVVIHHIISDAWSVGIFIRELSVFYEAFATGKQVISPPPAIQYTDFARWQYNRFKEDGFTTELNYWRKQLASAPALLELPIRKTVSAHLKDQERNKGITEKFHISEVLLQRLQKLSQEYSVSLFMVLHAVFSLLLSRYSSKEDIIIGVPVANRSSKEAEELIGLFVNTLPVRADLSGNPDFPELLKRLRRTILDAHEHQDIPFEKIVEELQPERNLHHTPIFQVLFTMLNMPAEDFKLKGLHITPVETEAASTKFDLSLTITKTEKGLRGMWQYKAELFDPRDMSVMLQSFLNLLEEVAEDPCRNIRNLPILSRKEETLLLQERSREEEIEINHKEGVIQLFEKHAEKAPERTALVYRDERISFSELNRRSNGLALHLRKSGVKPEVFVGICMERSADMIVALLGILKAGGAFVPFDPEYPDERLTFMMKDSGVSIILTQEKLLPGLKRMANTLHTAAAPHVIPLDTEHAPYSQEEEGKIETAAAEAKNAAYIIYTSGSTGRPKGVVVEHRSLLNYLHALEKRSRIQSCGSFAMVSTLAADLGLTVLFSSLVSGGTLHLLPRDIIDDAGALETYFRKNPVDCLKIVPTHLAALQKGKNPGAVLPRELLLLGGEAPAAEWVRGLKRMAGGTSLRILNHYGPTESTIGACCFPLTEEFLQSDFKIVPIGRPLANIEVYILDTHLSVVPPGIPGELYLGGEGLAREYLNQPELTKERFIPHPFREGARLYKTGDIARFLPDGNIEYKGRADDQVKIRGYRIEPGEVTSVIAKHPSVSDSIVITRKNQRGEPALAAFIVAEQDNHELTAEIRAFLQKQVPGYMVPSSFHLIDRIPFTPNGKVDHQALLQQVQPDTPGNRTPQDAPRTPTEDILITIWREILQLKDIGTEDNFFEAGGHSLLATQVVSRIQEAFPVHFPVRSFFENPTIKSSARYLDARRHAGEKRKNIPPLCPVAEKGNRKQERPLSYGQQRLWFLSHLESQKTVYNIPGALCIKGELNREALAYALQEILRRHEVLRTRFQEKEGVPFQVTDPEKTITINEKDLQALPRDKQEEEIQRIAEQEAEHPFNLKEELPVRVLLVRLQEDEFILFYTMHHIVSDGWSAGILSRELGVLYDAFIQKKPSPLEELPMQYADYGEWQRKYLQGEYGAECLRYWRKHLEGAPPLLELPADRPRQQHITSPKGGLERIEVRKELTQKLRKLSVQNGTSLFMTLYAAFTLLLYRCSNQDDMVIGTPIANRNHKETEPLIGFFVNTLAIRTRFSENIRFTELLAQVKENMLNAYTYQDIPFEMLVEELEPERNLHHTPLFQVMFDWQNTPSRSLELEGLSISSLQLQYAIAKFDLTLSMREGEDTITGDFEYNAHLFHEDTIKIMSLKFLLLLEKITEEPEGEITGYNILLPVEEELNTLQEVDIDI